MTNDHDRKVDTSVRPRFLIVFFCVLLRAAGQTHGAEAQSAAPNWWALGTGLEYATLTVGPSAPTGVILHVVRIDPKLTRLVFGLASEHGGETRTAGQWCRNLDLAVAINAGMYLTDHRTNCGYLRHGKHLNNPKWNSSYKAALGFGPGAKMVDLDEPGGTDALSGFTGIVQNLRLLKAPGTNVWSKQDKRWSEAAVGTDREGKVLFLFLRAPLSMWEFNEAVKGLPLGITRMMHVEGGPEASISIHTGGIDLDLSGSYETGFNENDGNENQWPITNVLGVRLDRDAK